MTPTEGMFFNGWFALLRTTVVGILAYAALVVLLRPTEDGNTGYSYVGGYGTHPH